MTDNESDHGLDDLEVSDASETKLDQLRHRLLKVCSEVGIDAEIREGFEENERVVLLRMPNGREKRTVMVSTASEIDAALRLDFERYVFLGNYVAIANYAEGSVEARVHLLNRSFAFSTRFLNRRIFGEGEDDDEQRQIRLANDTDTVSIEISEASDILKLLGRRYRSADMLSIKISVPSVSQHDKALALLRRISDSLFFQMDVQSGLSLSLVRERRSIQRPGRKRRPSEVNLEFPTIEIDEGPASLYWYARSAVGMPLLQFLAFYQVIEYYYPTYSQVEARKRIRTILKDPTFRLDRDADIGRVLSILSGSRGGFGDEKAQLRATLHACLDPMELRQFFEKDEERSRFFSAKQKGLTDHKIPIGSHDADLRSPVADMIYDIRCKIVHTKAEGSGGEVELLLPFSKEAELLFFDIELMQYAARQVLIAASAPMTI